MRLLLSDSGSCTGGIGRSRGVSLVELIVVITISGIIAAVLGNIIVRPIQGYESQVRRAALVDAAEMTVRRLGRDIRQALPNSVRVRDALGNTNTVSCSTAGAICSIEMLNTVDGARYREGPGGPIPPANHPHGLPQYRLKFNGADTDGFNIVGEFQNFRPTLPFNSTTERLAIYNQTATGANNAYAEASLASGPYVITNPNLPQNTRFTIQNDGGGDEWQIVPVGNPNFNFRWASPNQRVFIVDTPVTYVCNPGANGTITRYWNYAITDPQPTNPAAPPLSTPGVPNALLTTPVSACSFTYTAGTNQRAGLVTLTITLRDNASNEQVNMLYQAHVDNAP